MTFRAHNSVPFSLCDRFKVKLASSWTRIAACGNKYKDTVKILEWMNTVEVGNKASNAALLLKEVFDHSSRVMPPLTISHDLLVFSALVEIDRGDLVKVFQEQINDTTLWQADYYFSNVRDGLKRGFIKDSDLVIKQFDAVRWSYCPPTFSLGIHKNFYGGKWILPFCRRKEITEKGGTAQLWQVAIQQEHVQEDLRSAIERSKYMDEEFGWVCFFSNVLTEAPFNSL
jgi:hypothetical protein